MSGTNPADKPVKPGATPAGPRPGTVGSKPLSDKYPRRFGKYHLLSPLAQGGMGALYLAVTGDRGLERLMVIKTVLPHLADAEYLARFRDEAKVVVKLSHGNLIPVFDAGQTDGELFIAMDYVEGRDLRAVWNRCAKKQVAFPIDIAVYIAKELCRGLHYAHSYPDLALVHRDVSPPNILISFTGQVKLTDFGLASSTLKLEKTAPGIIYGKVAYMSPEQARGEKLDGRSDQYAAAIVLWELLTGRQLFPPGKDQPADLVARSKNPDVMLPSKRAPRVTAELDEICVRALAADPSQRYASCEEMRIALQGWLGKHAPTTDEGRVATFLQELFDEDIERERGERDAMVQQLSKRALTLPPTDEFRQLLEKSGQIDASGNLPPAVRQAGSIGRRASDHGDWSVDRREVNDRRGELSAPGSSPAAAERAPADRAPSDTTGFSADGATVPGEILGTVIDNRYLIKKLIGEGGMGRVYGAEHVDIGKRVAVKVLHHSYSRMPELVERFRREARAASKIGHPHIVEVFDSGTTADEAVYFVMEYLEGVELGLVLERQGALPVERALRLGSQICRALAAAHAAGVIHRDLKPENIFLVTRDGNTDFVKVLDFGIAKTTEAEETREAALTSPGMAMGTPEYMSPEQAAGMPADVRCDIYALGAILYEMLSGVAPYRGDNFMEILTRKATVDPMVLREVKPSVPESVSNLVMRAMSRKPELRPASMEAFEYELAKCLGGRGSAVAQILGVSSNASAAASRNPGGPDISGKVLDDAGAVGDVDMLGPIPGGVAGALSGPAAARAPSSSPYAETLIAPRDGQPSSPAFPTEVTGNGTAPTQGRKGMLGWLLLAAALVAGVVLLFTVVLGEKSAKAPVEVPVVAVVGADAREAVPLIDAGPVALSDSNPGQFDAAKVALPDARSAGVNNGSNSGGSGSGNTTVKVETPKSNAPPSSAAEAQLILNSAKASLAARNLAAARDAYSRVARGTYKTGVGLVGLGRVAMASKDYKGALKQASSALTKGASDDARLLAAEAYTALGDHRSAWSSYSQIVRTTPGILAATSTAKQKCGADCDR